MAEDAGLIARLIALLSSPGPQSTQTSVYTKGGERMEATQPTSSMTRDPLGATAAMGMSAADPLGLTSAAIGMVSPESREAIQGLYEAQPEASLGGAILAPVGSAVAGTKALGRLLAQAPGKSTAALTGLGIASGSAEAGGTKLTRRQQRALEIERQQSRNKADMESAAKMADVEAQAKAEENRMRLEIEGKKANAEADREQKLKTANTSIREMYPDAMPFVMPAAALVAGLAGSKIKGAHVDKYNAAMNSLQTRWKDATATANAAPRNSFARQHATTEAENFGAEVEKLKKAGPGGDAKAVGSGLAIGEIGAFAPDEIDMMRAIPGSDLQKNVLKPYEDDPWLAAKRLGVGAIMGVGPAKFGGFMAGRHQSKPAGYQAETDALSEALIGASPRGSAPRALPQSQGGSGPLLGSTGSQTQELTQQLTGQPVSSVKSLPPPVSKADSSANVTQHKGMSETPWGVRDPATGRFAKAADDAQALLNELTKK